MLAAVLALAATVPCSAADQKTGARPVVLDLEAAVSQAELILAVRLVDVTETKIVRGGRSEEVTEQYRLKPVRVLKGIFAHEALVMTGADLGVYRFSEGADRLELGRLLLVFLGRRNGLQLYNCSTAETLAQSIPRLSGPDDPLLSSVEVLIATTQRRDRVERVRLLRDGLKKATGREAVPLLLALQRRAFIAAQTPGALKAALPRLKEEPAVIREIAARAIAALLESDRRKGVDNAEPRGRFIDDAERREAALALAESLTTVGPEYRARVAILDAIAAAGSPVEKVLDVLTSEHSAATFAERAAVLRTLGRIRADDRADRTAKVLEDLPLDASPELEESAAVVLIEADFKKAADLLTSRLVRKSEAGLGIATDIQRLHSLPWNLPTEPPQHPAAVALGKAFSRPLDFQEQLAFATAAQGAADPTLVPALASLLDPLRPQLRYQAIEALRRINTDEAASALRPHLDEELDTARKLTLIAFLARHGFKGAYAIAIENLSQPALRDLALDALAALDDSRAVPELMRIWETSHDIGWNAAAIRGLARLGQKEIAPRLLKIADDLADPLAESALLALADLGDDRVAPMLQKGLASRSDALVTASAHASAKLLANPAIKADDLRDQVAALLADPMVSPAVRSVALSTLAVLDDPRLGATLAAAARDGALEGTDLGARIEAELIKRGLTLGLKD